MKSQPIRSNQIFLFLPKRQEDSILAFKNLKTLCLFFKIKNAKFSYFTLRDKFQESNEVTYYDDLFKKVEFMDVPDSND